MIDSVFFYFCFYCFPVSWFDENVGQRCSFQLHDFRSPGISPFLDVFQEIIWRARERG